MLRYEPPKLLYAQNVHLYIATYTDEEECNNRPLSPAAISASGGVASQFMTLTLRPNTDYIFIIQSFAFNVCNIIPRVAVSHIPYQYSTYALLAAILGTTTLVVVVVVYRCVSSQPDSVLFACLPTFRKSSGLRIPWNIAISCMLLLNKI